MDINPGLVVLMLVVGIALAAGFVSIRMQLNSALKELAYYNKTYLRKQGGTSLYRGRKALTYDLRSFDGGKSWYAVEKADNGGIKILGLADEVYPGLLVQLEAMDSIASLVGADYLFTSDGITLLKRAGFTIKTRKD